MPNLKDIRRRIRSVKNTQKITQAMRMVSAAKVKRAESRVKAARPYGNALREVFTGVYNEVKNHVNALEGTRYAELLNPKPVKNIGIIVISSDRGLCGSFNSSIVRQVFHLEREITGRGLTPKFYLVGKKVVNAYKRYGKSPILGQITDMTVAPSYYDANVIAETMTQAFMDGEIDGIEILSTHFRSMISYKIMVTSVLPVKGIIEEFVPEIRPDQAYARRDYLAEEAPQSNVRPELLLEPDPASTLDRLVPMYLSNIIYTLLLESSASELAARMTAMQNATKNAGEMIDKLSIVYNKARQASITQEILEVVSGAQALD